MRQRSLPNSISSSRDTTTRAGASTTGSERRANSVNPLYPATEPLGAKVARCEEAYGRRGLDTVFKLTGATANRCS